MDKPIPEAVRHQFETWARPKWRHREDFDQRIGAPRGTYNNIEVQAAWEAWQALTAAQQGQAVAWMCWHPNVNDGRLMPMERDLTPEAKAVGWQSRPLVYGDIAPQPTQQGGEEVYQWRRFANRWEDMTKAQYDEALTKGGTVIGDEIITPDMTRKLYAAPPSAPVGVDAPGSRAWMAEVCRAAALSLAAHGVRNDQLSKVADWITQQPAAVDEARWQSIETMPTDNTMILAKTGDGRVMIYRGSILARNLRGPTPEHLKFPAVKWIRIPGDVE